MTREQFQEELNKIPAYDIYEKNLEDLFNQDKSTFTQAEITKLYFEKAVIIPYLFADMESSTINVLTAFRTRTLNKNEDTTLISTFSYPHPIVCKKNGRANIIEKPVFYCSDSPLTAISELKPNAGDELFLSVWKINCNRKVQYTAFINPNIKNANPWYKQAQYIEQQMIEEAGRFKSKENELKLLLKFNSDIFIREHENYNLTSWLSNQSLYRMDGIDFIVYPSITTDTYSCNMAFHPNFIDNYFIFDRVYRIRFDSRVNDKITVSVGNVGKVTRTHIEWGDLQDDDYKVLPYLNKKTTANKSSAASGADNTQRQQL